MSYHAFRPSAETQRGSRHVGNPRLPSHARATPVPEVAVRAKQKVTNRPFGWWATTAGAPCSNLCFTATSAILAALGLQFALWRAGAVGELTSSHRGA